VYDVFKTAIIGDGYTAVELLRLLAFHNSIKAEYILSLDFAGNPVEQMYPNLSGYSDLICVKSDIGLLEGKCDAVFLALPHGVSAPIAKQLLDWGVKCVDLGADFRLKDVDTYLEYYGLTHQEPRLLEQAVYGIPELYREDIKRAGLVANPGCYPTSAIIPLAPLLKNGLLDKQPLLIDSKSGVSGAGRELKTGSQFCEVNEGIRPYGIGSHRHEPEIIQELSRATGSPVELYFSPHLVPMNRGMLSTIYGRLRPGVNEEDVLDCLKEQYGTEPFVKLLAPGVMPHTKWVYGGNQLQIGVYVDRRNGQLIMASALDNLTKGASGQAIQNMNLMLGLDETEGLKAPGLFP